jgi:hypothetical protein
VPVNVRIELAPEPVTSDVGAATMVGAGSGFTVTALVTTVVKQPNDVVGVNVYTPAAVAPAVKDGLRLVLV